MNYNELLVNEICNAIDGNVLSVSRAGDIISVKGNTISGKLIYTTKSPTAYQITPHDGFKWLTSPQAERVYQSCIRDLASIEEAAHRIDIQKWENELSLIADLTEKVAKWDLDK